MRRRPHAWRECVWLVLAAISLPNIAWSQALELSLDIDIEVDGNIIGDHQVLELGGGATSVGLVPSDVDIDAYHRAANGDQLYSAARSFESGGAGTVERADLVRFDGAVEMIVFDASAQGLDSTTNIDAMTVDPSGNLVMSFDAGQELSGLEVRDEDLVVFDGTNFSLFFDGSAQSVSALLDLDGAERRAVDGHLLLSFDAAGVVGGVFFEDEDVLDFDPVSGIWSLALDASTISSGFSNADVDSIAVPEPSLGIGVGVATLLLPFGFDYRVRRRRLLSHHSIE